MDPAQPDAERSDPTSRRPRRALLLFAVLVAAVVVLVGLRMTQANPSADNAAPVSGDLAHARGTSPGIRVLFVGNSFTYGNDLPGLVTKFAKTDKNSLPLYAVRYTVGGGTLQEAAASDELNTMLTTIDWDYVVLQEQSQISSFGQGQLQTQMYAPASTLDYKIRTANATTVLFMTWGYKDGDAMNTPGDSFSAMQARIDNGYIGLAKGLRARLAPVGPAWETAVNDNVTRDLWATDGKHPSLAGSYLAAAVFHAVLTGDDPRGSTFTAGLPHDRAEALQATAWQTVERYRLSDPGLR